jgi:hypothetical protein
LRESKIYLTAGDWSILTSLAFGGMLMYLFIVIYGIMGVQERFIRFSAPGEIEFPLKWAGTYIIYQEFPRTPDSKGEMRPGTPKEMIARMQQLDSGAQVEVLPTTEQHRFNLQRMMAEGVFQFDAPGPGNYRFTSEFQAGKETNAFDMVLIPTPAGRPMRVFWIGTALLLSVVVLLFLLAYGINWYRARKLVAPAGAAA